MATLNGQQINNTYPGLIKTSDEAAVGATLKGLEDGAGTTLPVQISTSTVNFTGTVTGDNNTTYDLASAQNVSDVDVTLTGSDATTDTIKLVAGTNITLTDSGTNQITIDAAGGGGAAGLVAGTGADSMRSADSLTTTPASAGGADSIALGDSASAGRSNSVAIGFNAHADGTGSDGSIAIGKNASASANKSIAIGVNGTTNSAEGIAIGDNVDIAGGADRVVAIGNAINVSSSTADDSIVIGTQAGSSNSRGIAMGYNSSVTANEAIALGFGVTASTAQYLTVRNLQLLNYAGLNYADDSAAATGGVPLGGIYHTSGALKIRLT